MYKKCVILYFFFLFLNKDFFICNQNISFLSHSIGLFYAYLRALSQLYYKGFKAVLNQSPETVNNLLRSVLKWSQKRLLRQFWDHFETVLRPFWDRFETVLRPFRDHSETKLRSSGLEQDFLSPIISRLWWDKIDLSLKYNSLVSGLTFRLIIY